MKEFPGNKNIFLLRKESRYLESKLNNMVEEVIYNISIQDFRIAWGKHIGNRVTDPSLMPQEDYLRTAYMIWARELFQFTTLKIIYKKGNDKHGHVTIPMPVSRVNFKENYKEIQAKLFLNKSLG